MIVPAVLAACERHGLDGRAALLGIAVGVETMCRLSTVAPTLTHKAGFHPTAVFGAMGAAAGVGAGIQAHAEAAGRCASAPHDLDGVGHHRISGRGRLDQAAARRLGGAIERPRSPFAGERAFFGPRTVFEGESHSFFYGFALTKVDYAALIGDFGTRWVTETLAFKPYPCGTMTHPYIDCARRLGQRIKSDDVVEMLCDVGEGTVHRLWEPLAAKQKPANGYAGKFSTPYCIAAGFVRGNVGLSDFSDAAVHDPAVLALAGKVRYRIDPQNPYRRIYPATFGRRSATARSSRSISRICAAAHARKPLEARADIQDKFLLNAAHGGWTAARAAQVLQTIGTLFDGPVELTALRD